MDIKRPAPPPHCSVSHSVSFPLFSNIPFMCESGYFLVLLCNGIPPPPGDIINPGRWCLSLSKNCSCVFHIRPDVISLHEMLKLFFFKPLWYDEIKSVSRSNSTNVFIVSIHFCLRDMGMYCRTVGSLTYPLSPPPHPHLSPLFSWPAPFHFSFSYPFLSLSLSVYLDYYNLCTCSPSPSVPLSFTGAGLSLCWGQT